MNRVFRNGAFFRNFCIYKKLFSPEECQKIINHFKKQTFSQATVLDRDKSKGNEIQGKREDTVRKGHLVFVRHDEKELNFVFQKLYQSAIWGNFGWSVLPPQFIQLTEYDSETDGGYYKRHRDIILDQNPQRILSCVVQLSPRESYEGCELLFDNNKGLPDYELYADQGDTILFLADEPHEVTPITSGVRYSLVSWFLGPPCWTSENLPERF